MSKIKDEANSEEESLLEIQDMNSEKKGLYANFRLNFKVIIYWPIPLVSEGIAEYKHIETL